MIKLIKYGDKRPGTRKLLAGERYATDKGDIYVEADCEVRTTEEYTTHGYWEIVETHWDQVVTSEPKPSFWARWFKRNKLPEAKLVKG